MDLPGKKMGKINVALAFSAIILASCGPTYPKCDEDNDCHEGEYCVNGMCQQCRDDTDCATGQTCAAGRCEAIENYCTTSDDCGANQECQGNRCVDKVEETSKYEPVEAPPTCGLDSVYFDFDSSELKSNSRDGLSQNATCIKQKNISKVHITGLTDPRGTEEYNLALGERRASSAKKYLESLGVQQGSITHSSLGEETARGTDESSWAQDRRVDIQER